MKNLLYVVKIRNLGAKTGFEKIIIKNGLIIAFFIANQMSPYYRGPEWPRVLEAISRQPSLCELKQGDSRLRVISRGIDSTAKALEVIKTL